MMGKELELRASEPSTGQMSPLGRRGQHSFSEELSCPL
jgi:hypothetical protein